MRHQFLNEVFGLGCGELLVEGDDEQMPNPQRLNQRDFVLSCAEQARRGLRSQNFFRVRVEGDDDRCTLFSAGVVGRSGNDRLMSAMNAVKNADGEKEGTGQARELGDGMKNFHQEEKCEMPNAECERKSRLKRCRCFAFRISSFEFSFQAPRIRDT